jgi:acetyl-CoA C-acetyltransferase
MKEVVVVSAARTPFGKFGGLLRDYSAVDLGTMAVKAVMKKVDIDSKEVDELIMGVAVLAGTASVASRQILFTAGLPPQTSSLTIDRACCSSTTSIAIAMRNIQAGETNVAIAGGMEAMSQAPLIARGIRWGGIRLGGLMLEEPLFMRNPIVDIPIAVGVGEVALQHGISREDQDLWALGSHEKFFKALEAGKFKDEITPVEIQQKNNPAVVMSSDESPRKDTSIEKLSKLTPVYGGKTVTAGNAPGLNDGATALLLMSRDTQEKMGFEPLATIISYANMAGDPLASPYMPAQSIKKVLKRANVDINDLKRIEINEAFAAVPLVSTKMLGAGDAAATEKLRSITNFNGGAVAIGHPTGASGARLIMTLIYELRRLGGGLGAAAICGGYGQSDALVIKVG